MRELSGKKVVIVAGPSASGKSYLIRQLMTKRKKNHFRDNIYRQLSINPQEPRSHISIGALIKLESKSKPNHFRKLSKDLIFIHFDITSRHQSEKQRLLRSIATSCKSIKVITLKTTFDVWHQRMRQRIDVNPIKNPSNSADAIYKLSRLSHQLANWRYKFAYKQRNKIINDIQPNRKIVVKNQDIPLKTQKPKS